MKTKLISLCISKWNFARNVHYGTKYYKFLKSNLKTEFYYYLNNKLLKQNKNNCRTSVFSYNYLIYLIFYLIQ